VITVARNFDDHARLACAVAIFVVGAGTLTQGCDSKFLVSYLLSSSTRLSWRTLWSVTAMWRTAPALA